MGREAKRVPVEFAWPRNKVWEGFLYPPKFTFPKCFACHGSGLTPEAAAIDDTFYAHQIGGPNADALAWHDKIGQAEVDHLIAKGRLRTWRDGGWHPDPRTAAEVNAANARGGMMDSHDGINRWILCEFRCRQLGIKRECGRCDGHGDIATDEQRSELDAWKPTEPPTGDGWQLWETVSEGSPISPVFATPEGLADWMGAQGPWDKGTALAWITGPAWAPSFVMVQKAGT